MASETLKWASLVIFTVQNAAFVLLMRASKVNGSHYNSSVAVLVTELIKLPLSTALLCYEMRSISAAVGQLWNDIALQPFDTLKISIPALLYTIQNNALFVAVGNLEAAVFQVTYQLKTLTTAVLTVVLLGRRQQAHQWFALVLLTAGAAMVQEPKKVKPAANPDGATSASTLMVGLAATILACVCSSVASVYLEKILTESKPSIWVRNAQLCLFTIPVAFLGTRMAEDEHIKEDGTPLHGFDTVVWAAIFTNALGGMLVATVMKFAGNILRNFAQASAIIVGGLGSWLFFGFQITMPFVGGVGLVILSIFIYGSKAELVTLWIHRLKVSLGMCPMENYHLVEQMKPLTDGADEETAGAPLGGGLLRDGSNGGR
jgi:UDP-sugar transporter A1/2/3